LISKRLIHKKYPFIILKGKRNYIMKLNIFLFFIFLTLLLFFECGLPDSGRGSSHHSGSSEHSSGNDNNQTTKSNAGLIDSSFDTLSGPDSRVNAIAVQTDGKVIIGGYFSSYKSISRNGIACINSDATLDTTFFPGTGISGGSPSCILAVALQADKKIIIGGNFVFYDIYTRVNIARIDEEGDLDTTFDPGIGVNGTVWSLAVQNNGNIIIGGNFSSYNGTPVNNIVIVDTNGNIDTNFNPGTGANGMIRAIAIQSDGKIIIGGDFTDYNGNTIKNIARLNTDGNFDSTFNPGSTSGGSVAAIAIQTDKKIIVGSIYKLIRLNTDGSIDSNFNSSGTGVNNWVQSIKIQSNGKIIIGGLFTSYNGTARNHIARLNYNGTLDSSFNYNSGTNSRIDSIAIQSDGKIIICGNFTDYDGTLVSCLARLLGD
jgi:uncharacterized delta-60 repeat protein